MTIISQKGILTRIICIGHLAWYADQLLKDFTRSSSRQHDTVTIHILELTSGPTLTFPCSHIVRITPSDLRLIVPFIVPVRSIRKLVRQCKGDLHSRLPMDKISLSINTTSPSGTGLRYVTLRVLLTPLYIQKFGFETGTIAVVVHQSNNVAQHPPWRFPIPLQWLALTLNSKTVLPVGEDEAETSFKFSPWNSLPHPYSC